MDVGRRISEHTAVLELLTLSLMEGAGQRGKPFMLWCSWSLLRESGASFAQQLMGGLVPFCSVAPLDAVLVTLGFVGLDLLDNSRMAEG